MERKLAIGRAPECDVVLADDSVSRRHAELVILEDGSLLLIDCHSTRGTRLHAPGGGSRAVHQELVTAGDRVQLGELAVTVGELLAAADHRPTPAERPWPQGDRLVRCE